MSDDGTTVMPSNEHGVPIRVVSPDEEPWKPNISSVGLRRTMYWRYSPKKEAGKSGGSRPRGKTRGKRHPKDRIGQPPSADVTVYTDGACLGNPGPGGHAAVIIKDGNRKEISGGFRRTTNQRMELMAAIAALEALPSKASVNILSDSKYLVDSMTKGWVRRWKARGWRLPGGGPRPNTDLWQRLLKAEGGHRVAYVWIRGHAGHEGNERADELAEAAARGPSRRVDQGYGTSPV